MITKRGAGERNHYGVCTQKQDSLLHFFSICASLDTKGDGDKNNIDGYIYMQSKILQTKHSKNLD